MCDLTGVKNVFSVGAPQYCNQRNTNNWPVTASQYQTTGIALQTRSHRLLITEKQTGGNVNRTGVFKRENGE